MYDSMARFPLTNFSLQSSHPNVLSFTQGTLMHIFISCFIVIYSTLQTLSVHCIQRWLIPALEQGN